MRGFGFMKFFSGKDNIDKRLAKAIMVKKAVADRIKELEEEYIVSTVPYKRQILLEQDYWKEIVKGLLYRKYEDEL
jgi:hypothetical protein